MSHEQDQWKLLGQRYRDFETRRLAGSIFRNQQGAFRWHLYWFEQGRPQDEYWCDGRDFFEVVRLDYSSNPPAEGQWKVGKKRSGIASDTELCMREAMSIWDNEERERKSS